MNALICTSPQKLSYESVDDPVCGPDDVIVGVKACGICGTDKHIFSGVYLSDYPLIMGHEFSGTVIETGKNVTGYRTGDRVTVEPNLNCGKCHFCQIERRNHCLDWQGVGVTRNGAFAEYVSVPESAVFPIHDLEFEKGAFVEPVSCCVWGLRNIPLKQGDQVLIFGAGAIGLILLQLILSGGAAEVSVVDTQKDRLILAEKFGAKEALVQDKNLKQNLKELTEYGFDIVVDATGVPSVVEKTIDFIKPGGTILYFGVCPKDANIKLNPFKVFKNDIKIVGSFASRATFDPAVKLISGNKLHTASLISHSLQLSDVEKTAGILKDEIPGMKSQIRI